MRQSWRSEKRHSPSGRLASFVAHCCIIGMVSSGYASSELMLQWEAFLSRACMCGCPVQDPGHMSEI